MSSTRPDLVIVDGRVYRRIKAKRLAVGDLFVPDEQLLDAMENGYAWRVRTHEFTARGDYSTFVESDGTEWSERFQPDETVWLVTEEEPLTDEELMAKVHAAVERTRAERGIDRHHDSGADSGSLSEDEERELADRGR